MRMQLSFGVVAFWACMCAGCNSSVTTTATEASSRPADELKITPGAAVWSREVNGLSGRLLLERESVGLGLRYAVFLELRNTSPEYLQATNQPHLTAELVDHKGKAVPRTSYPMSGPIPRGAPVGLSAGVYAGFRVDVQTMGVPAGKTILLAIGGDPEADGYGSQAWSLSEGKYTLRVTATFWPRGNAGFWYDGTVDLPPVEITISESDLHQ